MAYSDGDPYAEIAWEEASGASCGLGGTDYWTEECGWVVEDLLENEFGQG